MRVAGGAGFGSGGLTVEIFEKTGAGRRTMVHSNAAPRLGRAVDDLVEGCRHWPMWHAMARQDILIRYRGSMLGPFWLTLSMAVMVLSLGLLYSHLLKVETASYIPYLCLGLLSWSLISSLLLDSGQCFTIAEPLIKQIRLPLSIHVYRMIWRNLIIAGHNLVVYIVVMLWFGITPTWTALLVLPGLALVIVNAVWVALLLGMMCARFRDIPQIVASLTQIAFFLTPIIWSPDYLGEHRDIAHLNPFFAYVDLLRAPLLNEVPHILSWVVALIFTAGGWALTLAAYSRFRARVSYWV